MLLLRRDRCRRRCPARAPSAVADLQQSASGQGAASRRRPCRAVPWCASPVAYPGHHRWKRHLCLGQRRYSQRSGRSAGESHWPASDGSGECTTWRPPARIPPTPEYDVSCAWAHGRDQSTVLERANGVRRSARWPVDFIRGLVDMHMNALYPVRLASTWIRSMACQRPCRVHVRSVVINESWYWSCTASPGDASSASRAHTVGNEHDQFDAGGDGQHRRQRGGGCTGSPPYR